MPNANNNARTNARGTGTGRAANGRGKGKGKQSVPRVPEIEMVTETYTWRCPVPGCGREHDSVKVGGGWVQGVMGGLGGVVVGGSGGGGGEAGAGTGGGMGAGAGAGGGGGGLSLHEREINERRVVPPHYARRLETILITSTQYRSQAQNVEDCLSKLHTLILTSSTSCIINPTSEETKKRIEGHVKAAKERKKVDKARRSGVKAGRGKIRGGDW
ncbi:hypothetical protein D9758_012270 [Tetrapyrgos nigripes]|uniref:Uncharacterized protein n=1 Tax=Tetrapyrgos nigripes TaxID=182062 RepID=A0A8H5FLA9_9AGAR|nr:hypothetical protein D9758_012270 [Tetrapyrgos nigripes]